MARRRWTFTINNPTEADYEAVQNPIVNERFVCVGEEAGKKKGTPHLQGYIEFTRGMTMAQVKRAISDRMWCAPSAGTADDNEAYTSKEDVLVKRGTPARPGTRNDLVDIRDAIRGGAGMRTMLMEGTIRNFQGLRMAEALTKYFEPVRDWKPEVRWYWGPAGSGKSRAAREWLSVQEDRFVKTSGSEGWWDGYDGHPDVIWDDFRDSQCSLPQLLTLLDRYEHKVNIKGGMRNFVARRIAITSVRHPKHMYENAKDEPARQLRRRIDEVVHVGSTCTEVGGNISPDQN